MPIITVCNALMLELEFSIFWTQLKLQLAYSKVKSLFLHIVLKVSDYGIVV